MWGNELSGGDLFGGGRFKSPALFTLKYNMAIHYEHGYVNPAALDDMLMGYPLAQYWQVCNKSGGGGVVLVKTPDDEGSGTVNISFGVIRHAVIIAHVVDGHMLGGYGMATDFIDGNPINTAVRRKPTGGNAAAKADYDLLTSKPKRNPSKRNPPKYEIKACIEWQNQRFLITGMGCVERGNVSKQEILDLWMRKYLSCDSVISKVVRYQLGKRAMPKLPRGSTVRIISATIEEETPG